MVLPIRFRLAGETGDTLDRVRDKERALNALNRPDSLLSRWKRVADVWCAPWFGDEVLIFPKILRQVSREPAVT